MVEAINADRAARPFLIASKNCLLTYAVWPHMSVAENVAGGSERPRCRDDDYRGSRECPKFLTAENTGLQHAGKRDERQRPQAVHEFLPKRTQRRNERTPLHQGEGVRQFCITMDKVCHK